MKDAVIIAGAGPAGAATALFLLHHRPDLRGRVVLLERKRFPRDKFCAGALGARADRLLAAIGVRIDVPSVPIHGVEVHTRYGRRGRAPGHIGRVIRRYEHDEALARAAASAGARLEEGVRVDGFSTDPTGVSVLTSDGERRARVLVGADGVGSAVRRGLGLPFGRYRARVIEVDTPTTAEDAPGTLAFHLHPDLTGYLWDFPTRVNGEALTCRGVYALAEPHRPAPDVTAALEDHLLRRGLALGDSKKKRLAERGFDPHAPVARPRVLLVGEAAGIDPLTGEGIPQAIAYGALAGRFLARALARDTFGFESWPRAVKQSSLGIELAATRAVADLYYRRARRPLELALMATPRALDLTTALFAGHLLSYRDLP